MPASDDDAAASLSAHPADIRIHAPLQSRRAATPDEITQIIARNRPIIQRLHAS